MGGRERGWRGESKEVCVNSWPVRAGFFGGFRAGS